MIRLYENGVYLVGGTELIEDGPEAGVALAQKLGQAPAKEEAARQTIAYSILEAHNTSGRNATPTNTAAKKAAASGSFLTYPNSGAYPIRVRLSGGNCAFS